MFEAVGRLCAKAARGSSDVSGTELFAVSWRYGTGYDGHADARGVNLFYAQNEEEAIEKMRACESEDNPDGYTYESIEVDFAAAAHNAYGQSVYRWNNR